MVKILDDLKLWPYDAAQVKSVNYKKPPGDRTEDKYC